jgi:hypothetical protein
MPTRTSRPIPESEETADGRGGVRFGTGIAYDDAYAGASAGDEYVAALPTLDEERKMEAEAEDVRAREREETFDAGHAGGGMHPSTMAAAKVSC